MARPRRRNTRSAGPTPEAALAASLPAELRSLEGVDTSESLQQRLQALGAFAGRAELALPVFNAAGHSVAGWYRKALTKENP